VKIGGVPHGAIAHPHFVTNSRNRVFSLPIPPAHSVPCWASPLTPCAVGTNKIATPVPDLRQMPGELQDPWLRESSKALLRLEMWGGQTKLTAPPRLMPEPESTTAGGFEKTRHPKPKCVDIWLSSRRLMLRKSFCGAACKTRWASFEWTG